LQDRDRVSLEEVVGTFNWPISEEQAWAVIHQTVRTLGTLLELPGSGIETQGLALVTHSSHLLINLDGSVANETFLARNGPGTSRDPLTSEDKALSELGRTIYMALDQGLEADQERTDLSPHFEDLLYQMVDVDSSEDEEEGEGGRSPTDKHDDDDEGVYVNATASAPRLSGGCGRILGVCRGRLANGDPDGGHFPAVCRALVSEAVDLSTFMDKVATREAEIDEELNDLALQDWARLWVAVLKDLRKGASRLKQTKTNDRVAPVEFELTPYEMLMEEIRGQRYTLHKVPPEAVNTGDHLPPNVTRDAHDVILEFIRSRPPLKPAADRRLGPRRKESTPAELLMDSIRGSTARTSLRKTNGPELKSLRARLGYGTECSSGPSSTSANRKPVDLGSNLANLDFETGSEGEEEDETDAESNPTFSRQTSRDSTGVFERVGQKAATRMASGGGRGSVTTTGGLKRSNSGTVCQTPKDKEPPEADLEEDEEIERNLRIRAYKNLITKEKVPHKVVLARQFSSTSTATARSSRSPSLASSSSPSSSRPSSRASSVSAGGSSVRAVSTTTTTGHSKPNKSSYQLNSAQMHASLHSEFIQSDKWAKTLETLDLNMDEVIHIRSVLTKAEMEGLPLDGTLKEDVEKGKVCFLCMKTRFGFWSGYGHKCQLCKQRVCHKCSTKMSIPLEQFSTTPVFTLEPPSASTSNAQTSADTNDKSKRVRKSESFRFRDRIPSFFRSSGGGGGSTASCNSTAPNSPDISLRQSQHLTSSLEAFPRTHTDEEEDEYANTVVASASSVTNLSAAAPFGGKKSSGRKKSDTRKDSEMMNICVDCREMVLQVIRAQSTARRLQLAKSLFMSQA